MSVAVLTDSTACLPPERAEAAGVAVIPLHVVVGGRSYAEGVDITAGQVADLLRSGRQAVSTSRPSPGELIEAYRGLAAGGATQIVSAHLSAELSGTVEAAQLAAVAVRDEVEVRVVDSRVLGMALGYAACDGAAAAAAGGGVAEVADLIERRAAESTTVMYLDSLEFLRRGGRVGTAQAILGQALAIKPLLTVADGQIGLLEKVRTRAKAMTRLREVAADAARRLSAGGEQRSGTQGSVRIAIHQLGWSELAEQTRADLATALRGDDSGSGSGSGSGSEDTGVEIDIVELGAVTAVHAGPSTLAVVVSGPSR